MFRLRLAPERMRNWTLALCTQKTWRVGVVSILPPLYPLHRRTEVLLTSLNEYLHEVDPTERGYGFPACTVH